jgi:hypothetical protein
LILPVERVGAYVRALHAGLDALAPHEDYVPLAEALAHLRALDPELSGDVLLPAEVNQRSGMPSFVWMERASSEKALAVTRPGNDASEDSLTRAEELDLALGQRLRHRRDLHRHLRQWPLLPTTRIAAAVRSVKPKVEVLLSYDRQAPDGRWVRVRADFRADGFSHPFSMDRDGLVSVDPALLHLMTRHFTTSLLALREQLVDATGMDVTRLARSWVGPFWFPGVALPPGVDSSLSRGLLLHLLTEVVSEDVSRALHLDPLTPIDPTEQPPPGQRIYRERRFAATPTVVVAAEKLGHEQGIKNVVIAIGAPRRRRL